MKRTFPVEQSLVVLLRNVGGLSSKVVVARSPGLRCKRSGIMMVEEDEVIGEDGGIIAPRKKTKHEEIMMDKGGNRGTVKGENRGEVVDDNI